MGLYPCVSKSTSATVRGRQVCRYLNGVHVDIAQRHLSYAVAGMDLESDIAMIEEYGTNLAAIVAVNGAKVADYAIPKRQS
jgi:hypothetical protein